MLKKELHRVDPREVITQESLLVEDPVTRALLGERAALLVNRFPDWSFDMDGIPVAAPATAWRGQSQGLWPAG